MNGYQSPFSAPVFSPISSFASADLSSILTILFFIIFVVWVIYTVIAAYHWFRYSRGSWLAVPAMGAYIVVSGLLIFYIAASVT